MVERVRQSRADYEKPHYPERPLLGLTDAALIEMARRHTDGKPLSQADKDTLMLFGNWRHSVFLAEGEATGRLMVLLTCIRAMEAVEQDATKLREWIFAQYGRRCPKTIGTGFEQHRIAEAMACDLGLLPRWLRTCDPADAPREVQREVYQPKRQAAPGRRQLSSAEAYEKSEADR